MTWLYAFLAMIALDYVWAAYTLYLVKKNAPMAGAFSSAIMLFNSYVTISYVMDPIIIVPVMAGAFVGTFLAIRFPLPGH